MQITWQTALCFSYLCFFSLLSTCLSQTSCMIRHSYLFSSVTLSPIFPCFSPGCFQSPAFPFHFSKLSLHTVASDNFYPCLLLSSDSISLPMHWFCPLAYPKLIPLKCSLSCPLSELSLVARTALRNGGYRNRFSVLPVCLFSVQPSIGALLFLYVTLQSTVMLIPDSTTDLSKHFTLLSMSCFSLKRNCYSPNPFPFLSNTIISIRGLY